MSRRSFIKLQEEEGEILVRYQFNGSGIPEQPEHSVPRLSYIAKDQFPPTGTQSCTPTAARSCFYPGRTRTFPHPV